MLGELSGAQGLGTGAGWGGGVTEKLLTGSCLCPMFLRCGNSSWHLVLQGPVARGDNLKTAVEWS
jgi:hypothetical protein